MKQQRELSINELKKIHLCDCSYLTKGIDILLENFETANDFEDIDDSILFVPLHNEDMKSISLYHYTNANALLSIISSGPKKMERIKSLSLRFSRVDYMNDIYDGGEIFNFIFHECLQNELVDIKESFKQYIKEMVELYHSGIYSNTKRVSYVCSLTFDGDSLPMWRNYSSSGGGYNLKFDSRILEEHSLDGYLPEMTLIPVVYDYNVMFKIIKSLLIKLSIFWNEDNKNRFDDLLHNFISTSKLSFKHPSFSHEQEIRLVKYGSKRIHDINLFENFNETNAILRPYINVEIPKNALIGVTVGPLLETEAAKHLVEDAINRYVGLNSQCHVNISAAPIRF